MVGKLTRFGYNLRDMNVSPTDKHVGHEVYRRRALLRSSQQDFVERMRVIDRSICTSQQRLSQIERGVTEAKWRELRAIAIATETDINVFIEAS